MLLQVTEKLLRKENLSFDEAQKALNGILGGECTEVAIAGFLTAFAAKGETGVEMAGMAQALRDHAVPVKPKTADIIDVVGTGGDGSNTFNISTISAIVAAGAGAHVAKHGNRAITSQCGSADILAALGVKIDAAPDIIARCIDEAGMGFMFAPSHHPTMRYVQPVREALGFRTLFNVLGPLANPARVPLQMIGVASPELIPVMAEALKGLGVRRALVIHGGGMDELSICDTSNVMELRDGKIESYAIDCTDYGLSLADISALKGGSLEDNVRLSNAILNNQEAGPCRDIVVLNAAAAIMLAGIAGTLAEAITAADNSITSAAAAGVLKKMIDISNQ